MIHLTQGKSMSCASAFSLTLALCIGAASTTTLCASAASAQLIPRDSVFRNLIVKRLQAYDRGNAKTYDGLLAEDFVHVDDVGKRRTHKEILLFVAANVSGASRHEVGELHARLFGQLAIVDCEAIEYVASGPREIRMPFHETNVFVLRKGRWLFLHHAETHALSQPKPLPPDAVAIDSYVGRYEWWPGYIETISRRGNELFSQDTGDKAPTAMHPASAEAYFADGDPSLTVFVRDSRGKVTSELVHFPDGQTVAARRME